MTTQIEKLRDQFYDQGFLVLPSVLSVQECEELKEDIRRIAEENPSGKMRRVNIYKRLFEKSEAHLMLFMKEPVVSLAEAIISDPYILGGSENKDQWKQLTTLQTHVIHNNALVVKPGQEGINIWHQDDPPHYIVKDGKPPENVHLPVLLFTANYYLNDVLTPDNGPTVVIPGSHKFGQPCPESVDESKYKLAHCLGPAGSVVLFNNQVWHRGSPNKSSVTRYVSQVTYARRIIGHKYWPFMNYQMPKEVVDLASTDPRFKRLIGFLGSGPYG